MLSERVDSKEGLELSRDLKHLEPGKKKNISLTFTNTIAYYNKCLVFKQREKFQGIN